MTPSDLRAWREARSLSRSQASAVLGVDARTIEAIELGRRDGRTVLPILERLTAALDRLEAVTITQPS